MKPSARERAWTWTGAAVLFLVMAALVAVALIGSAPRPERVLAIGFAAGVCLAGSLAGWFAGRLRPADPALAVGAGLAAVSLRFFPALAAVTWIAAEGGSLRIGGAAEWLLIFYLAVLATDILLHIIGARNDGFRGDRGGGNAEN